MCVSLLEAHGICCFLSQEAIEAFGRLSAGQYATGWVLSCVGRACFEAVDYPQVHFLRTCLSYTTKACNLVTLHLRSLHLSNSGRCGYLSRVHAGRARV